MPDLPCTKCSGTRTFEGRRCIACGGEGRFSAPSYKAILENVTTKRGLTNGRRRLRATAATTQARDYYVWKMTQVYGGMPTSPYLAQIAIDGDPYLAKLDKLAKKLAQYIYARQHD